MWPLLKVICAHDIPVVWLFKPLELQLSHQIDPNWVLIPCCLLVVVVVVAVLVVVEFVFISTPLWPLPCSPQSLKFNCSCPLQSPDPEVTTSGLPGFLLPSAIEEPLSASACPLELRMIIACHLLLFYGKKSFT